MPIPIGDRIRYYRESKGMTMDELGKAVGVNASTINKYEKGIVTNIPIERLKLIANALDVEARDLVDWFDEDVDDLREELKTNPDLRILLSASAKLNADDLRQLVRMAKLMRDEQN